MEYTTTKTGNTVVITDELVGVAIRFTEGETLQRYTHEVLMLRPNIDAHILAQTTNFLVEYAATKWPLEFKEL